jgi:FkbM family methyltransferase
MDWSRLTTVIHRVCRSFGLDIIRYPPTAIYDPRSVPARRARWLEELGVTVVMDVGANNGGYARQVRRHGYRGRIISFEPLSSIFAELEQQARGDAAWQCENLALGPVEAVTSINVSAYSESSSLLRMHSRHVEALPESAYIGEERVRVFPLDALRSRLLQPDDIVWLKLDVQGYEFHALKGATQTLEQVTALEMELSLVPLYEGQVLFCESIERLTALGFHLISVEDAFQDTVRGHTLQVNGIFQRERPSRRRAA